MTNMTRFTVALLALAPFSLGGCPDSKPLPLGSTCGIDAQCESGLCLQSTCLCPEADNDHDGLINGVERALGTNPLDPDTDGDGLRDDEEVGSISDPANADGDSKNDAVESNVRDHDGDCIPDQADPDDDVPETDPATLGAKICAKQGVCADAVVTASCELVEGAPVFTCDYNQVGAWQDDESLCDGLDNDCDGDTDEAFAAGGSVTFDGGPYAADAGKVLGESCGAGACDGGVVICDPEDAMALTCSTLANAAPESCDPGDDDCDGETDEGGPGLDRCVTYYADADNDSWGGDQASCLCAADATYTTTQGGDCAEDRGDVHPQAAPICGEDADCVDGLRDAGEVCDDGNDDPLDGCNACAASPWTIGEAPVGGNVYDIAIFALNEGWVALWTQTVDEAPVMGYLFGVEGAPVDLSGSLNRQDGVRPQIARLDSGGFVAVWHQFDGSTHAQRFDGLGAAVAGAVELSLLDSNATSIELVGLHDDRYAVAWAGYRDGHAQVRVFEADGTPVGDAVDPAAAAWTQSPVLTSLSGGGVVAAWQDYTAGGPRSAAMRWLDGDGGLQGDIVRAPLMDGEELSSFTVAAAPDDGVWAVFAVSTDGNSEAVYVQRYDAGGQAMGGRLLLEDDKEQIVSWEIAAASQDDGTLSVVWGNTREMAAPVRAWIVPTDGGDAIEVPLEDGDLLRSTDGTVVTGGEGWFGVAYVGYPPGEMPARVLVRRFDAAGTLRYH